MKIRSYAVVVGLSVFGLGQALPGCKSGGDSGGGEGGASSDEGGSSAEGGGGGKGGAGGAGGAAKGGTGGSAKGGAGGSAGAGGTASGGAGGSAGAGGTAKGGAGGSAGAGDMPPATAPVVPTDGLLAHYKFDDGAGTVVKDSSPNRNDGLLVQGLPVNTAAAHAAPPWEDGLWGKTIHFNLDNAMGDWVRVPSSASLEMPATTNKFTVAAWVKWEIYGQLWNFFIQKQKAGTGAERWALGAFQGLALAEIGFGKAEGAETLKLKKWMHMAVTYDGTTIHYYENGAEAGFMAANETMSPGPEPLTIGCGANYKAASMADECNERFKGWLDELVIYSRALSNAEIAALAGQ